MTLIILLAAVVLLGYANGANDNFKAVATLYGSSTLSYRASLAVATGAQLLGSLASAVLAGGLLRSFGGKGLVPDAVVADPGFLLAVGCGAAGTVLLATRVGLPISTTHALIGGLCGAGLGMAPSDFAWHGLGANYALPLLVSPLLAMASAAVLYPALSGLRQWLGVGPQTCLCAEPELKTAPAAMGGLMARQAGGVHLRVGQVAECRDGYSGSFLGITAQGAVDGLHLFSGSALGFARGLNDTPKIMALLVAAAWSGLNPRLWLILIAAAMALGGLLHSRHIARTMSQRITQMNTGQGLLANVVASSLVIGASLAGSPVSTTHVSAGAIFGIGMWTKCANWRVVGGIILAWGGTLPIAAALAYLIAING